MPSAFLAMRLFMGEFAAAQVPFDFGDNLNGYARMWHDPSFLIAGLPFSLTPKQLAESLMLSGAGMTSRLDRLEQLHLVARLPEPNDRRSLKIQLTQKGVKLIDEVIPQIVAAQWQLVSALGDRDTATLVDLLRRLTETLFASIDPTDLD